MAACTLLPNGRLSLPLGRRLHHPAPPCAAPASLQAVSVALQVLALCARAARYIEGKQLFKAFKTLEAVQRDHGAVLRGSGGGYLPLLPTAVATSAGAASREGTPLKPAPGGAADGGGAAGASSSSAADQLGLLAGFLRERVAELVALLEQRAIADFNNWLANVRAQARTIGMRAIRWAASERQQEEALTRQRKLLLPQLEGLQDMRQAGALVAQSLTAASLREPPPATPLPLPAVLGSPGAGSQQEAAPGGSSSPGAGSSSPAGSSGSTSASATAARFAAFKAARQAAGSSPARTSNSPAAAARAAAAGDSSPPGTAASSNTRAAAAAAAAAAQTPPPQAQLRGVQRSDTFQVTGGGGWGGCQAGRRHTAPHRNIRGS